MFGLGIAILIPLVLLAVVFVVLMYVVGAYNGLVTLRNRYKNAYAQIDVQLKRRYDLIPNLVETAKGYLKHERETLENVIKMRNIAYTASQAAATNPGDAGAVKNWPPPKPACPACSAVHGDLGIVSRPEGQPEHDAAHRRADLDRKQNLVCPPGLQRFGDDLQHEPRSVPVEPHRRRVQLHPGRTVVIDKPEQKEAPQVKFNVPTRTVTRMGQAMLVAVEHIRMLLAKVLGTLGGLLLTVAFHGIIFTDTQKPDWRTAILMIAAAAPCCSSLCCWRSFPWFEIGRRIS